MRATPLSVHKNNYLKLKSRKGGYFMEFSMSDESAAQKHKLAS